MYGDELVMLLDVATRISLLSICCILCLSSTVILQNKPPVNLDLEMDRADRPARDRRESVTLSSINPKLHYYFLDRPRNIVG